MRFNPLPPSMSTLVSRKPSTIGLRTNAAGARAVRNLGSSLAFKGNSRVTPWVYCCYLVDFGKVAEGLFPRIV